MVGLDDLKGLFQSKWFYDSNQVADFPDGCHVFELGYETLFLASTRKL